MSEQLPDNEKVSTNLSPEEFLNIRYGDFGTSARKLKLIREFYFTLRM
jgi:hypothetical protein